MKKLLTVFACAALLLAGLSPLITGCKSVEKTSYTAASVTAATVDRAIQGWSAYVTQQKQLGTPVPLSDELKVKQAWQRYQNALGAVTGAGYEYSRVQEAGITESLPIAQAALTNASAALGGAMADLVELIASFGLKVN
jgi:hypothetical protein